MMLRKWHRHLAALRQAALPLWFGAVALLAVAGRGAEPTLPDSTKVFGRERAPDADVVLLRDATSLRGQVLNETFTINTPYGLVTIPRSRCAGVSIVGAKRNAETIVTVNGNRFSGLISDPVIRFRTAAGGAEVQVRRERADLILFKTQADERSFVRGSNPDLFIMWNGDLLTGRIAERVLKVRTTTTGEVAIAVADLLHMGRLDEPNHPALFLKQDGMLLEGALVPDQMTIQLDVGATLKDAYVGRFAWALLGNGYRYLDRFAKVTGPLDDLLLANLTVAFMGAFAGETVENSLGMRFRRVKPGTFLMGWDQGTAPEQPVHTVNLTRPFYLGVHEVTQGQFQRLTGRNPSSTRGTNWPVESVNWQDAADFCARLTEHERAAGWLPTNFVYRLPTEAEWECACRAGTTTRSAFGDDVAALGKNEWLRETSDAHPHDVGTSKPNPWGFFDMLGNVEEWCQDWYGPYSREAVADPTGPPAGTERVFRGSSWMSAAVNSRSALRNKSEPFDRTPIRGFRVALGAARSVDSPGK